MKTICTEVYQYHELSPAAQEIARQWWVGCLGEQNWWEDTKDEFHELLEAIGFGQVQSGFSGFSSQGDGAHFEGDWTYPANWKTTLEDWGNPPPVVSACRALQAVAHRNIYKTAFSIVHRSRYQHSGGMRIDCAEWVGGESGENDIEQACRQIADWYYARLRDEWDFLSSPEQCAEAMEANGYTFTNDGKRFG